MNQRSKRWRGKSRKLAKKGVRPFRRGRQWERASPMESSNVRWGSCPVRQERTKLRYRSQSPARRKDTVLAGGIRCISDEQMRRRQRRKDAAAEAARPKGQHSDPGIWREGPIHARQVSERRKVGTAVPPRSVCWNAQFVVKGSGCHRAGTGVQDTHGQRLKNPRVGEMGRGRNTRNTSLPLV